MTEAIPPTPNPEVETGHESVPEAVAREMGDRAVGAVCPHCHERIGRDEMTEIERAIASLERISIVRKSESGLSPEDERKRIREKTEKGAPLLKDLRERRERAELEYIDSLFV